MSSINGYISGFAKILKNMVIRVCQLLLVLVHMGECHTNGHSILATLVPVSITKVKQGVPC